MLEYIIIVCAVIGVTTVAKAEVQIHRLESLHKIFGVTMFRDEIARVRKAERVAVAAAGILSAVCLALELVGVAP